MSLPTFQRAFYDLIANPAFCIEAKNNPLLLSEKYDLTAKELTRLNSIIWQKGMSTNCTLYRVNRVTPIYTLMPYTCKLLGDEILPILNEYWLDHARTKLQYKDEVTLFCNFLRYKLECGMLNIQYLDDILNFEATVNEIRYQQPAVIETSNGPGIQYKLHPQARVISFKYDPGCLIKELLSKEPGRMSKGIPVGEYFLLLRLRDEEMEMSLITNELASILSNVEQFTVIPDHFIAEGYVIQLK
ncbi:MAG TPA: hypothetical protein VLC28_03775 [Flavitalea sp.]|nr:hypothetical protein [Flavitalea sp.]